MKEELIDLCVKKYKIYTKDSETLKKLKKLYVTHFALISEINIK